MDPRHMTPGNYCGSGGRSRGSGSGQRGRGGDGSGDGSVGTSRTRRSRLSAQSAGTSLMPEFNDAAEDDDGWVLVSSPSSPSSGGFDSGLEEYLEYSLHRVQHEAPQNPNLTRLLFQSSPSRQPSQDDEVIVMDGVLVDNTSVSAPRRLSATNDQGFLGRLSASNDHDFHPATFPGPGGSGRYGLNRQFSDGEDEPHVVGPMNRTSYEFPDGKDEPRVVRPMKRTSYEMEPQIRRPVQGTGLYMQRPPTPRGFPLFQPPPPVPGAGVPPRDGGMIVPGMNPGYPGPGGFPLFPPPLPLPGAGAPPRGGGGGTIFSGMNPGYPGPGGFPLFPPSFPGAGPPRAATMAVPVRTPAGPPHFTPQRQRATPTAASAGPPPGFLKPQRRIVRVGNATTASARPPPPPPPTPVAQHHRTEFSWPPKTAAAAALPPRAPDPSAQKRPKPKRPETEAPPASSSSSSARSPREAFTWPLTEEEDELITNVLYGPSNRRRLPVCKSICPD